MRIYLGFAKRDMDSGFKAGECCLVYQHEPKGGDFDDFEWRWIETDSWDAARAEYEPAHNDITSVARYELHDDDEIRPAEGNKERLKICLAVAEARTTARLAEGVPLNPEFDEAQVASLKAQTKDGFWTRLARLFTRG